MFIIIIYTFAMEKKEKKAKLALTGLVGIKELLEIESKEKTVAHSISEKVIVDREKGTGDDPYIKDSYNERSNTSFIEKVEYYRRVKRPTGVVYVDAELKEALERFKSTGMMRKYTLTSIVSAIVEDFIERENDMIKEAMNNGDNRFLNR